jgi:hypothetical protein
LCQVVDSDTTAYFVLKDSSHCVVDDYSVPDWTCQVNNDPTSGKAIVSSFDIPLGNLARKRECALQVPHMSSSLSRARALSHSLPMSSSIVMATILLWSACGLMLPTRQRLR